MAEVGTLPPLGLHTPPLPPPLNGLLPGPQFGRLQLGDPQPLQHGEQQQQQQQQQGQQPGGLLLPDPDPGDTRPPRVPVHLRHTASSRLHATVDPESDSAAAIRALLRRDSGDAACLARTLPPLAAGAEAGAARHRAENVRELVARKRQIFLAQMSLDTKHTEIAKLEQRASQREEALVASEHALDLDSQRFEEYLKENDAKLQEALKRAEGEARARGERSAEAKRLAGTIAALRSETSKIEEQLAECQKYKAFLDSVTPAEWFESLAASRAAKKAAMRQAWEGECGVIAACKAEAAAAKQRAEHEMQWARTQQQFERAERAHREAGVALREALGMQDPPEPEYGAVDAEETGMHFTDPSQLLAVFSQLEGSNMFQIQTAQDAEAALDSARTSAEAAEAAAAAQAAALSRQVADLEAGIAAARERCTRLQAAAAAVQDPAEGGGAGLAAGVAATSNSSAAAGVGSGSGGSAVAEGGPAGMAALGERLAAAYEAAGFARDASVTQLQMLQKVEGKLEELLAGVGPAGGAGALMAEAVERAREKERRQAARLGKLAAQQAEHEARVARVQARAAAPKFQKLGKPAMTRSVLVQEERRGSREADEGEAEELAAFLAMVDEALTAQ